MTHEYLRQETITGWLRSHAAGGLEKVGSRQSKNLSGEAA